MCQWRLYMASTCLQRQVQDILGVFNCYTTYMQIDFKFFAEKPLPPRSRATRSEAGYIFVNFENENIFFKKTEMKNKKIKKSFGRCVSASRRAAECGSARFRSMGPRCSLRGRWSAFSFSLLHFRCLFIFLPLLSAVTGK